MTDQTEKWGSHTLRVYMAKDGSLSVRMDNGFVEPSGLTAFELFPEDLLSDDDASPVAGWEMQVWEIGPGEMLVGQWHWQVHEPGLRDSPYARGYEATEDEANAAAAEALAKIESLLRADEETP